MKLQKKINDLTNSYYKNEKKSSLKADLTLNKNFYIKIYLEYFFI